VTSQTSQRPYLRVVSKADNDPTKTNLADAIQPSLNEAKQPMLFSDASLHTLGFIRAADLDADRFAGLIREAKPRIVFDLRQVPSFARGSLTRRQVFALFEKHEVTYYDVAGVLGVTGGRDGLLNPALLIDALQINILRSTKGLVGPIFFFVNEDLFYDDYFSNVAKQLPSLDGRGWDIACWPNEPTPGQSEKPRDLVFISHANPEDNEVALWLSSRLAASGYQVWSDVTRLVGGEIFWDTIEDAIRKRAAKVIALLSKRGHQKPGLLDEVNIAIATERVERLERFVIPVRIDDLAFTEVRANLARKNVIDGCTNLAGALSQLLTILKQDAVPRNGDLTSTRFAALEKPSFVSASDEWSVLFENKVAILKWPRAIRKFRGGVAVARGFHFPTHPVSGGIVTFEDWDEIAALLGGQVQKAGEAVFDLSDSSSSMDLVFGGRGEARRAIASLLRQGWDTACTNAGFSRFVLANNSACWFLESGFQVGNRVRFRDHRGIERQKALVGQSPRRGVHWHFAIEARPNVVDQSLRLVPHVVFSEDGKTPLVSHDRQHSLRRGFCRNWWNSRWRDLLFATLSYLASGEATFELPISKKRTIQVSAKLSSHTADLDQQSTKPLGSESPVLQIAEPRVAVGYGQTSDYPKEGLFLFGPVSFERNPKVVRAGVVGTKEGIELFNAWSKQFITYQSDSSGVRNSMPFPGFEAVFGARWNVAPLHTIALSRTDLINTIRLHDRHQAIFRSAAMYVDRIAKAIRENDVDVDVWYVVIPDEVYVYGRPESRIPSAIAIATPGAMGRQVARRFSSSSPSLFPEDNAEALIYDHHLDFHHQLKARLLGVRAVTQVLRESSLATVTSVASADGSSTVETLPEDLIDINEIDEEVTPSEGLDDCAVEMTDDEVRDAYEVVANEFGARPINTVRQMQDRASVAWNLATTTFFKAGGRPWRVADAREGVCYVGLIFKRDAGTRTRQSCCGAQMFLQESEGLVFKGAMGPWYSPETGQFHLSRSEARRLIERVLTSYAEEHSFPPRELFIHGRTRFNQEEWIGFHEAINQETTKLVAVRISRSNEFKLFSSGELAVRRGTALRLSRRLGLLWTSGFVERLGTYPGRETPNPLRIEILNESLQTVDVELVMSDILMLTKMNFNSCIYGDGIPVTMRFADAIGDVLVTAKDEEVPPLPFRYYI
jgi:hypothetical protein